VAVHRLYPDFFRFLDALANERGNDGVRWENFERLYYGRHRGVLSTLWFEHQTYSRDNIRERVLAVKPGDYGELRSALLRYDLPGVTEAVLERCAAVAGPFASEVYLLVGFFSPDAFAAECGGKPSIFVGLERFRTFAHYPTLLSHECCHLLMGPATGRSGKDTPDRAVREGLAVYFSRLAFPDKPAHSYVFMRESAYRELSASFPDARAAADELRKRADRGGGLGGPWGPGGSRAVYFLGYMLLCEYMERTGLRDIRELIARTGDISMDFGLR
jgi:hypothetical protein